MSHIPTNEEAETMAHAVVTAPDALNTRDVCVEMMRARRVEQEQAEQLRQKDEVIRALADVLEAIRREKRTVGVETVAKIHWSVAAAIENALAKAGRKP